MARELLRVLDVRTGDQKYTQSSKSSASRRSTDHIVVGWEQQKTIQVSIEKGFRSVLVQNLGL